MRITIKQLICLLLAFVVSAAKPLTPKNKGNPALLTSADLLGKMPAPAENLRQQIRQSYMFIGDFESRERTTVPKSWLLPQENPARALLLGTPRSLKRPEFDIELPLLALPYISYFEGEGEFTTQLNTVIRYWSEGELQKALTAFDEIEKLIKDLPKADPSYITVHLLRGWFHMEAAINDNETLSGMSPENPNVHLIKATEHFTASRGFIRSTINTLLTTDIITADDKRVAKQYIESTFSLPQYFVKNRQVSGKKGNAKLTQNAVSLQTWLHSIAVPAFWNAVVYQSVRGAWQEAFIALEKLESIGHILKSEYASFRGKEVILATEQPKVTDKLRLQPHSLADMVGAGFLTRTLPYIRTKDPLEILVNADKAIRAAESPDIWAAAFYIAGATYYDLNSFALAKTSFAWGEAVSDRFVASFPALLLYGAESAFWLGDKQTAKRGFQRFLELFGEKQYGPWARLRLAEIENVTGEQESALQRYDEIVRLYPAHDVLQDAFVRSWCIQVERRQLLGSARIAWKERLPTVLQNARDSLKQEAATCVLKADLQSAEEKVKKVRRHVLDDANIQLALIKAYEEQYPASPYFPLFIERQKHLKLAPILAHINDNKCLDAMNFYSENKGPIDALGSSARSFVSTLALTEEDWRILLRCTARHKREDLWTWLLDERNIKDNSTLPKVLLAFAKTPSKPHADKVFAAIKGIFSGSWASDVLAFEKSGDAAVRNAKFWIESARQEMLAWSLSTKSKDRAAFLSQTLKSFRKTPRILTDSEYFCLALLENNQSFEARDWDRMFALLPRADWLTHARVQDLEDDSPHKKCIRRFARDLLSSCEKIPSPLRDSQLLLPYLEESGVAKASESWLAWAQRLEAQKGASPEVMNLYKRILRETENPEIKAATQAWLEARRPPNGGIW